MRKIVRTLLAVVGAILIVSFAVANRGAVEVSFWPMPFVTTMALYWVLLAGIVIGVILGGLATWLSGHRRRVVYRSLRSRVSGYEQQERQRKAAEEEAAVERARESGTLRVASSAR